MNAQNSDRKGSLEFVNRGHAGPCRLWKSPGAGRPGGYVTQHGGLTQKPVKAAKFSGPGEAINMAQRLGFAILSW